MCMFSVESAVWACMCACLKVALHPQSWHSLHGLRLRHIPHASVLKKLLVHCSHHSSPSFPWMGSIFSSMHTVYTVYTHTEEPELITSWVLDFIDECEQIMSWAVVLWMPMTGSRHLHTSSLVMKRYKAFLHVGHFQHALLLFSYTSMLFLSAKKY